MHHQPILHGPLRFYLTAAMYLLFGDSDFTANSARSEAALQLASPG